MKNVNAFVFIVLPAQFLYNQQTFRSRHLLIHESFATREVCSKYRAEELCYVPTLLDNFEESRTGINHKVCGEVFLAKILDSQYCSPKCNMVDWKRKKDTKEKNKKLKILMKHICLFRSIHKLSI